MKSIKTSTFCIVLSAVSATLQTVLIAFLNFQINQYFDISVTLLAFFIAFVINYLILYFVFRNYLYAKIDQLYHLVKSIQAKEIPNTEIQLEEVDSIDRLEKGIIKLSQERSKEIEQYNNIDSYRKEFLGNVSHELKTPIFNIQGYISTLIDGGIHDSNINMDYLKKADKSIDRMIRIVDDLETISQLEVGTLELDTETYDLVQQIKDIIESLELIAAKKNIRLQFVRKSDKPILVKADSFRIRQVLVNLITNSIKYGLENGKTRISIQLFDEQVIVEVKDNGIGIDEKHLPRVFERFYRVDKGRSREQGGTGLGLAIVKHIIEAHHGTIDIESKLSEGTTVTFTLASAH